MFENIRQILGSPVWQFVSVVLTLIAVVIPFIVRIIPYNQAASWIQKVKYILGVGLSYLLSVLLLIFVVALVGTTPALPNNIKVIVTVTGYNIPQQTSPTLNVTPSPHHTSTSTPTYISTPTPVFIPTQIPVVIKLTPTQRPKPTPTPVPQAYPRTITENITTPCDSNNPSYIEGRIDSVETVSSKEVIYNITFINNSDNNLGLNTYIMSLQNNNTGTSSQAQQPSVAINAHSSTSISYTFDNISIMSNTRYTLSWDISEGNVFTCTFPNETLLY